MSDQPSDVLEPSGTPELGETLRSSDVVEPESAVAAEDVVAALPTATPPRRGRPLSVSAVSLILLIVGGAMEGYAVALSMGDSIERQYSLAWAFIGATLVVTAWALRGRRWWGAAAAIGVSIVGLFAGMAGVYSALVIASTSTEDRATWLATLGLIGVGAASIAIIGLLSSAWSWLTATTVRTAPAPPSAAG
jgi:hypothetical protein